MLTIHIFYPPNTWFPEQNTIILNELEGGDGTEKRFIVTCQESCQDVKIKLRVERGEPFLFALDESQPRLDGSSFADCIACSSFCSSRSEYLNSCDILTERSTFYVLIYGFYGYYGGEMTIEYALNVEPYGKLIQMN